MLILGIETSCDETSAAVVRAGRAVLSNVVSSQVDLHAPYGGVVPEIASRQHVRAITLAAERALADAHVSLAEINAVAATRGPGLAGALLVGYTFGQALALGRDLPFIPVNHLEGHVHSAWLTRDTPAPAEPALPLLALIVSGGHTELVVMRAHGSYELVGRTLDDAAGEAFDKVARLLGLSYPGGPVVQKAATRASAPVQLPRAWLPSSFDFSFSGLKTATLHLVRESAATGGPSRRNIKREQLDVAPHVRPDEVANIAAGFQESVVDVLVEKTRRAADQYDASSVAVVGGVAANAPLRARLAETITRPLFVASPEFCTDNAAMIAGAAYFVRPAEAADVESGLELSSA
ncbi:MAG TPA: tRNA (adenosine(37)-N6)-threonylcarbamoyltransferase complex transferase subunit TsaD [Chloroflexota bacterium]